MDSDLVRDKWKQNVLYESQRVRSHETQGLIITNIDVNQQQHLISLIITNIDSTST